jgi:hypothetical protein
MQKLETLKRACASWISALSRKIRHRRPARQYLPCNRATFGKFHAKSCCDDPQARLVASKFSTIVLGGTAALHAYRAWGAVLFWSKQKLPTLKAQHPTSKIPR